MPSHEMKLSYSVLFATLFALTGCATTDSAHTTEQKQHDKAEQTKKTLTCTELSTHCANTVTATFSQNGTVWIAWVNGEYLYVQSSTDKGQTFGAPIKVNSTAEKITAKGENRPKIKLDAQGNIYLTWALSLGKRHAGHIRFARSTDAGKTFSTPITVNDNLEVIGHSFDSLAIGQNGELFITWIDARDSEAAKVAGQKFEGSSLYYTWSQDGGKSFYANKRIATHVCQCCRLQTAIAKDNTPVVLWRHIFTGGIRDHALVKFNNWQTVGDLQRVGQENWKIDACPHHGAGLAIADNNVFHAVWFSNADSKKGLFYAQSNNEGKQFSQAMPFAVQGASHPHIATLGQKVAIVWQEFDSKQNNLRLMKSNDAGKTWMTPETVATATEGVDTPFLISDSSALYLSWQVQKQDFQLKKLNW